MHKEVTTEHSQQNRTSHAPEEAWLSELDRAVTHVDEAAIWQIMDAQSQNHEAHEALANMVSRMAYERQGVPVFCEIFMMPVIAEAGCDIVGNDKAWKTAQSQIRDSLAAWLPKTGQTRIFDGLVPFDWVSTWNPGVLRQHLLSLVPGSAGNHVKFQTATIDLPTEAPRLGFVVIGRAARHSWPELPHANALMDQRLKEVVKYSLQIAAPTPSMYEAKTPIVLAPERVQYAMADGVTTWLNRLNETVGIEGWTFVPSSSSLDVVKVTLKLRSDAVSLTQFTLRLHQIGMQGLNDVATVLGALAPMLDRPLDSQKNSRRPN